MEIQLALVGSVIHTVTTKVLATSGLGHLKFLHGQQHISAVGRVVDIGFEFVQRWQPLPRKPKVTRQVDFLKGVNVFLRANMQRQPHIVDIKPACDRVGMHSLARHDRKHQYSGNKDVNSMHVLPGN